MATFKELKEVKENRYTVIKFRNGKRVLTIAGCDIVRMAQEVTDSKDVVLVFNSNELTALMDIQPDLDYFLNLKKQ